MGTWSKCCGLFQVWTYDDEKGQVQMDKVNQTLVKGHGTRHFVWEPHQEDFVDSPELIKVSMIARQDDKNVSFGEDGYIKITVSGIYCSPRVDWGQG